MPKAINSVGSIFSILASKQCGGCRVAFNWLKEGYVWGRKRKREIQW